MVLNLSSHDGSLMLLNGAISATIFLIFTTVPFALVVSYKRLRTTSRVIRDAFLVCNGLSMPLLLIGALILYYYYFVYARRVTSFLSEAARKPQLLRIVLALASVILGTIFIMVAQAFWMAAAIKEGLWLSLIFAALSVLILMWLTKSLLAGANHVLVLSKNVPRDVEDNYIEPEEPGDEREAVEDVQDL